MSKPKLKARRTKTKEFGATPAQLLEMSDVVLFYRSNERGKEGWIYILANEKGRECFRRFFPDTDIDWRLHSDTPKGFKEFEMNLPRMVGEFPPQSVKLRTDFMKGTPFDECTPDALCFVLARNVTDLGGRCICIDAEGSAHIYPAKDH
jgi:hypothetical protein